MNRESYNTKQKDKILKIIKEINHEFTIKDIYMILNKKVGLTTIYRLVDKMVENKELNKYITNNNKTYYEYLKKCNQKNHFYLKCDRCSNLIHIDCNCIKELENHVYNKHKFIINHENIIINGICNECQSKCKAGD